MEASDLPNMGRLDFVEYANGVEVTLTMPEFPNEPSTTFIPNDDPAIALIIQFMFRKMELSDRWRAVGEPVKVPIGSGTLEA